MRPNIPDGKTRRIHMSMSIRGALRQWKPADFMDVLVDGKKVRHWKEGRNVLEDLLAKGVEVVPLCSPEECPDFHDKDGCPGHIMDKVEGVAAVIA